MLIAMIVKDDLWWWWLKTMIVKMVMKCEKIDDYDDRWLIMTFDNDD